LTKKRAATNLASASKATKKPRPSNDNDRNNDDHNDYDDNSSAQVNDLEVIAVIIATDEALFDVLGHGHPQK
jgi:hypothetical protein